MLRGGDLGCQEQYIIMERIGNAHVAERIEKEKKYTRAHTTKRAQREGERGRSEREARGRGARGKEEEGMCPHTGQHLHGVTPPGWF